MKTLLVICLTAAGLAGCAVVPYGPGVYVAPAPVVVPYYGPRGHYHRW